MSAAPRPGAAAVALEWWFSKWRGHGIAGPVIGTMVALVLLLVGIASAMSVWLGCLAVGAGLLVARRKWPGVRLGHYFLSARAVLPAALAIAGLGVQTAAECYLDPRPDLVAVIVAGAIAAIAAACAAAIYEGKIMKSIFDLVPADQRASLQEFTEAGKPAGAPRGQFADFSALDCGAVAKRIKARVIGQDAIVDDVVRTAFRRARLRRQNKPVATFLFVGATGAGKTELAKAMAAELFDGLLIRVDCNELSQPHNVARLIGAPPGYVGSDQGGQLCRDIGRVGTGVLLFDEIEKADASVMKVIMGLLDEGRLTEQSTGHTYSATGFVIVMTSNAAADGIAQVAASVANPQARIAAVKDELKAAGFLPEVLARIDSIFPFAALSRGAVIEIVGRFLLQFAKDAGVQLVGVDSALLIDLVLQQEKLADYGVREVVRLVENSVVDGLLSVRDEKHTTASIRVRDGHVVVEPGA